MAGKLILYDFECHAHGLFEDLVQSEVFRTPCPQCGELAQRQVSPVRIDKLAMALQSGASPTSIDYFDHVHRQRQRIEQRYEATHGDYGPSAGADGGISRPPDLSILE